MEKKPILVVDDETNIRLTVSQSLEPPRNSGSEGCLMSAWRDQE